MKRTMILYHRFLEKSKGIITPKEVSGLFDGFFIITCEIAMRFLHDYIDGDNYFKIAYPTHNLVRARNQIKMAKEVYKNKNKINKIIKNILIDLNYDENFIY